MDYDALAQRVCLQLPDCPCVVILGSASFWHPESERTCQEIGATLGELSGFTLVTGGVGGVGDTVGRSFYVATRAKSGDSRVVHLLPEASVPRPYGLTLYAGNNMWERREVLGRVSGMYVVVEGGPGTEQEAAVAISRGATVIPVGRSGGAAAELYKDLLCPTGIDGSMWSALNAASIHPRDIAESVKTIVSNVIEQSWIH